MSTQPVICLLTVQPRHDEELTYTSASLLVLTQRKLILMKFSQEQALHKETYCLLIRLSLYSYGIDSHPWTSRPSTNQCQSGEISLPSKGSTHPRAFSNLPVLSMAYKLIVGEKCGHLLSVIKESTQGVDRVQNIEN